MMIITVTIKVNCGKLWTQMVCVVAIVKAQEWCNKEISGGEVSLSSKDRSFSLFHEAFLLQNESQFTSKQIYTWI